jgi:hypothetical protein
MRYLWAAALLLFLLWCGSPEIARADEEVIYRINCGATSEYVDRSNVKWLPDQLLEPGKTWGALGGGTVTREKALPIHDDVAPELYRTERCGVRAYEFQLPNGTYTVRLHFAETHANNFQPGKRVFDIALVPGPALKEFDPIKEAGAFASPAVMEFAGLTVADGKLRIQFTPKVEAVAINAIEVLKTDPAAEQVRKLKPIHPGQVPGRVEPPAGAKAAKVLFIGNSLTGWWALPETLQDMVNSTPGKLRICASSSILGGASLQRHYNSSDALKRIQTEHYDYVVLQDYTPLQKDGRFSKGQGLEYASKFDKAIREAGGKTLIYCTWVGSDAAPETQEPLTQAQLEIARTLKAAFVPVGPAWQTVRQERPDFILHNSDKLHPGVHGAYLRDCVFYAVLTGQSPVGIPFRTALGREVEVEKDTAAYLQEVAWKTVLRYRALESGTN